MQSIIVIIIKLATFPSFLSSATFFQVHSHESLRSFSLSSWCFPLSFLNYEIDSLSHITHMYFIGKNLFSIGWPACTLKPHDLWLVREVCKSLQESSSTRWIWCPFQVPHPWVDVPTNAMVWRESKERENTGCSYIWWGSFLEIISAALFYWWGT